MIKKNLISKIMFVGVLALTLPGMVFAAGDTFIQSCEKLDGTACILDSGKYQVGAGETVKIIMSVETEKKINGFSSTIDLENMSNVSDFSFGNIWSSDSTNNGNTFLVFRDSTTIPETEELKKEIGSFKVTAGTTLGAAKINFVDIDATYLDGTSVEDYNPMFTGSIDFNVVEATSEQPSDNATNNEATDNKNNSVDTKKTKKENPVNPKTGVAIPLASMFVSLGICGISYVILRKKGYFNGI